MDVLDRVVEWGRAAIQEERGALGVLVVGWHHGTAEAREQLEARLREHHLTHHVIDMHLHHLWVSLTDRLQESPDSNADLVSVVGIREWVGPGEEAARELGEKLEAELPSLLDARRRVVLWLTPHIWDTLRRNFPRLAEQWTVFERLAPSDPAALIGGVFERWLLAIVPMRHRGHPERARRRMERFRRQMDTFSPQVLNSEQLAWGIVIPWLRTLLDAGAYGKVVEEFRRWAPSLEPVAAAYGLSMLCAAGAEMILGRTGSAKTTLEEAGTRLRAAGHTKGEAISASMIGQLEALLGKPEESELKLAMGTQLGEVAEARRLVAWNCTLLTVLTLLQGREEEAHNYLEYAWVVFETEGDVPGLAITLWADAVRLWWFGLEREAKAETRRVERVLTIVRDGPALVSCATALAFLLRRLGKENEARELLERTRSACTEIAYFEGSAWMDQAFTTQGQPAPPG